MAPRQTPNYTGSYGTAQFKLDIYTHVTRQIPCVTPKLHTSKLHKQIIKLHIYTRVTLEELDKFIGSLMSCTQDVNKFVLLLASCMRAMNKFIEPFASCTRVHDLMNL